MRGRSIRVSSLMVRSVAHGPGERFVVWVQGCTLGCRGCFSASTHSRSGGHLIQVPRLVDTILATKDIEGVTYSGGEPFQQAAPLADLAEIVRGTGLTVMCYTGFTLAALRRTRCVHVERLLGNIDVLVDGRFVETLSRNLRWRGSSNQKIHWLTSAYEHLQWDADDIATVEVVAHTGAFTATGIWPKQFVDRVRVLVSGEKE